MDTQKVKPDLTELQKLDCNCNDCKFLVRDLETYNRKSEESKKLQKEFFNSCITNSLKRIEEKRYEKNREELRKEILSQRFIYIKKDTNYGYCNKLEKEITFYPNVFSLETQNCFVHRKE